MDVAGSGSESSSDWGEWADALVKQETGVGVDGHELDGRGGSGKPVGPADQDALWAQSMMDQGTHRSVVLNADHEAWDVVLRMAVGNGCDGDLVSVRVVAAGVENCNISPRCMRATSRSRCLQHLHDVAGISQKAWGAIYRCLIRAERLPKIQDSPITAF